MKLKKIIEVAQPQTAAARWKRRVPRGAGSDAFPGAPEAMRA
jgi:hypothetical protein